MAAQTFREVTACTLENFPTFAISADSRASTPAPQTTAYFPAADFTKMRIDRFAIKPKFVFAMEYF
jgi:hypothetical protein